jgi:hypothetical protein
VFIRIENIKLNGLKSRWATKLASSMVLISNPENHCWYINDPIIVQMLPRIDSNAIVCFETYTTSIMK